MAILKCRKNIAADDDQKKAIKFYCSCHKEDENQFDNKIFKIQFRGEILTANIQKFFFKMKNTVENFKVEFMHVKLLHVVLLKIFRAWKSLRRRLLACLLSLKLCHLRIFRFVMNKSRKRRKNFPEATQVNLMTWKLF